MMKMTGRVTYCCVSLLFAVASVSAVQYLDSIDDLRRVVYGGSVPQQSLVLLYWFAHTVDIYNTDDIRLTFDPENNYGSHHFGNYEGVLGPPPNGHKYYTVGNRHKETSDELPSYVLNTSAENKDRIVFGARGRTVDRVYITQHQGRPYDQANTYEISTNLLREIRQFPLAAYDYTLQHLRDRYRSNANISSIRNTWANLVGLGLFLYIVNERWEYLCATLQSGRINESNWNTGSSVGFTSGHTYTSASQDDMGFLCTMFFIILICCFLFFVVNLPKV